MSRGICREITWCILIASEAPATTVFRVEELLLLWFAKSLCSYMHFVYYYLIFYFGCNLFKLSYMQIIDCVLGFVHQQLGGTELKRSYTWGYTNISG
jgi:hypothetical protein